jgi:hypothetical protein
MKEMLIYRQSRAITTSIRRNWEKDVVDQAGRVGFNEYVTSAHGRPIVPASQEKERKSI